MTRNIQATLYIGNLDERVDERLLYEIMVQAGPLEEVYIPRDKESKRHKGYGFAEYQSEESAQYALSLFSGLVSLYNRSLRFAMSGGEKTPPLAPGVDKSSYRCFSDKLPHHLVEESGLVTSCRAQDVKGYPQQSGFQTLNSHYNSCISTGIICNLNRGEIRFQVVLQAFLHAAACLRQVWLLSSEERKGV